MISSTLQPILTLDGISVSFSGRAVLHDVHFTIGDGKFVGLLGSNGAGKTTILRIILGLQNPTAGTITRGPGVTLGYVPQKVLIDPDLPMRARDVVSLGIDGQKFGIPFPSAKRKSLVDSMLEAVDATSFGNERVGSLSGGELQRILIAHALISKPKLLLLDEPLANLDIRSEQEVVTLLSRIVKEQGISIFVSAHDINAILPALDHVVYVASGHVASGTTEEVVTEDVLSKLYGHHVDVLRLDNRILVIAGRSGDHEAVHHD